MCSSPENPKRETVWDALAVSTTVEHCRQREKPPFSMPNKWLYATNNRQCAKGKESGLLLSL
jgi:hypothetical protein